MTWELTRLKRVVALQAGGTPDVGRSEYWAEQPSDGIPWVTISDMTASPTVVTTQRSLTQAGLTSKRLAVAPAGTVLFAMYASVGALGTLGREGTWNQAILGLRPRASQCDRRFLHFWLQYLKPRLSELTRSNTQDNLNAALVGDLPFPLIDVSIQARISDYLDTETARIDALIAAKAGLEKQIVNRRESWLESEFSKAETWPESRTLPLGRLLVQLTNGYVGPTRDILTTSGVLYVQGLHIKEGTIDFGRRPYFVSDEWHYARPRTALRAGDVVIVQTGDIGQTAVVPEGFGPANCHALLIARPRTDLVTSQYLGLYLNSSRGRQALLRLATGALHPHLEFGIKSAEVLLPLIDQQNRIVASTTAQTRRARELRNCLGRQITLLRERRQALITAAVTGELEIPGVA